MNNLFRLGLVGICAVSVFGCGERQAAAVPAAKVVKVRTAHLEPRGFRDTVRVQGTIQSKERADISARIPGTLDNLAVEEGDKVRKNQTLFRIDRVNLENRVALAQQDLAVAQDMALTAELDLEIARTTLDKAKIDFQRAKKLREDQVMSVDGFEQADVGLKKAQAAFNKTEAVLRYQKTKVQQAQVSLDIAGKNLKDSVITAPFDGVVTAKNKEANEFAAAGMVIFKLENLNRMEISALISAVYYDKLTPKTNIDVIFNRKVLTTAPLSYCASAVDPLSRTFEVRADLPIGGNWVSGTLCDIDLILVERNGLGIERNAVLFQDGGKHIVYEVVDGKARALPVEVGITSDGYTEIMNARNLADKSIIVSGQYFVNDGSPVEVVAN